MGLTRVANVLVRFVEHHDVWPELVRTGLPSPATDHIDTGRKIVFDEGVQAVGDSLMILGW